MIFFRATGFSNALNKLSEPRTNFQACVHSEQVASETNRCAAYYKQYFIRKHRDMLYSSSRKTTDL